MRSMVAPGWAASTAACTRAAVSPVSTASVMPLALWGPGGVVASLGAGAVLSVLAAVVDESAVTGVGVCAYAWPIDRPQIAAAGMPMAASTPRTFLREGFMSPAFRARDELAAVSMRDAPGGRLRDPR